MALSKASPCLIVGFISLLVLSACQKYEDQPGQSDPRLARKYCNDPEAVNFNFDFPGTADNSVCYYPSDVFAGTYSFNDSIYTSANKFAFAIPVTLYITAQSRTKFDVSGLCPSGTLHFTSTRILRASADSTVLNGQTLCRVKDTVSGFLVRKLGDSTRMQVTLTVLSDTGATTHQGTAYRQ
jgi:hypothetical protein